MSDGTSTSTEAPSANGTPPAGEGNGSTPPPPPPPPSGEDAEALRSQLGEARQADRAARQRIKALEGELETAKRSAMSENERAVAEAAEAARNEVEAAWRGKYLTLRVERLAATKLADPADATRLLDMDSVGADTPDEEIGKLLDALLASKPYLAASARNGTPSLDRGPRGGTPPSSIDMNELLRQRR